QKNGLHFTLKGYSFFHWMAIFKTGFSSFLLDITSGFVMFVFNIQILKYIGDIGVSVYGIITNTAIIINCLSNGISQAAQPIISTNYGAGLPIRIKEVRNLAMKTALCICSVFTLLGWLFPNLFTYIFMHPNEQILMLAPTAIRVYFSAFIIIGLNMFMISYFQATVNPRNALILCLLRGCILSTLFVFILPPIFGIIGIWAALPLAEFITLGIGWYFMHHSRLCPTGETI
ncbi:MAG: MATE family efflux transporter, partial [Lachnospiraceae bacterium]|nr:MATE family efflux transporter [Lachnospiraceae bacterium]